MSTHRRPLRLLVSAIIALTFVSINPARLTTGESDHQTIEGVLKFYYVGQVLILRNFYEDSNLNYNSDGRLKGAGQSGDWTLYGAVAIRDFKLRNDQLEFSCARMTLEHDARKELFRSRLSSPLQINIEINPSESDLTRMLTVLNKIFLAPNEKLANLVPDKLKSALGFEASIDMNKATGRESGASNAGITLTTGEMLVPASPVRTPNPEYSEEARRAKVSGALTFWIVVDERGNVVDVALVAAPLGSGLDKEAVKTIRTWKFRPATIDGKPVKFRVGVGVSFRLL